MKKSLFIALFAVISLGVFAQGPGDGRSNRKEEHDQIAAQKVAYITEKLSLTPVESEKFWPLYNQYWAMNLDLARAKRKTYRKIAEGVSTQLDMDALVKLSREEVELMDRYSKLFATVLPIDKVAKFFVEQENFKGVLMRRFIKKP